jgi:hypothetical protein
MKVTSTWQHLGKPRAAVVVGPDAKTPAELKVESATDGDAETFDAQVQVDYVKIDDGTDDGKRKRKKGRHHGD